MPRTHTSQLIQAIQERFPPPGRVPSPPSQRIPKPEPLQIELGGDLPPVVVPPEWQRPLPSHEVQPESGRLLALDPDDEVTIDAHDEPDGRIPVAGMKEAITRISRATGLNPPPFDALAYYLPFHFYSDRWGIYIKESGILELACHLVGRDFLHKHERWIVGFAAKCLFLHEFFHHASEIACSRLEYPLPTTLFGIDRYTTYFYDRAGNYVEEAMANAFLADHIGRYYFGAAPAPYASVRRDLLNAMDRQPAPYSEFRRFSDGPSYTLGRDVLIDRMYSPWLAQGPRPSIVLGSAMYYTETGPLSNCPTYLVLDRPTRLIQVGKPFPKDMGLRVVTHSLDHDPPHVHVEILNTGMSARYLWPSLKPYAGDKTLPAALEKRLGNYVKKYEDEIWSRMREIYPRAFGSLTPAPPRAGRARASAPSARVR